MTKAVKYVGHPEGLANAIRQYIGSKPHDEVAHLIKAMEEQAKIIYHAESNAPPPPPPPPPPPTAITSATTIKE